MSGLIRIRIIFSLTIVLVVTLFMILLVITAYSPRPTTYSVNAITEIVEVQTSDQIGVQFDLSGATIYLDDADSIYIHNGFLALNKNVKFTVEWISDELVIFSFDKNDASRTIGAITYGNDRSVDLHRDDIISIQELTLNRMTNGAIIIPFLGDVKAGRNVGHLGAYSDYGVLKSGEITMIGKSIWQNKYFEADKYELSLGDEVLMYDAQSEASGLIYIGDEGGLRVSYRIVALKAWIKKPGAVDNETKFQISTSLLNRFLNDQLFKTLSLTIAFLIGLFTLLEFIRKTYSSFFESMNAKKKRMKKK
ncbi:MAG: hypothetical protein ABJG47_14075 [Ekhidna sp.]